VEKEWNKEWETRSNYFPYSPTSVEEKERAGKREREREHWSRWTKRRFDKRASSRSRWQHFAISDPSCVLTVVEKSDRND